MDLQTILEQRYSVRAFDPRPIEPEKLERVLNAARLAPTAKNAQPQRIYVLESEVALAKIRALTQCAFNAPIVLLFAFEASEQWHNPLEAGITSGVQDVSIAATQAMLKAFDEGLGSCWVGYFPNSAVHDAFDLPASEQAVLLLPIGYPAKEARPAPAHASRKPLSETVQKL